MKKLFVTLLIVALSISLVSCDLLKKLEDRTTKGDGVETNGQNSELVTPKNDQIEVRIYSNAYDGYVNVRAQPNAKAAKLGKLRNGTEYLVKLGTQGNWTIVKWQETIGYINSSLVGETPWKPVYLDIDGDSIQGVYGYDPLDKVYLIFSNGKFAYFHEAMASADDSCDLYYGTWRFEGWDIIFTTKYITEEGKRRNASHIGAEVRLPVKKDFVGDYYTRFCENENCYDFGHVSIMTMEEFFEWKKVVNKRVRLK